MSIKKSVTIKPKEDKETTLIEQFQNLTRKEKSVEQPKLDRYERMRKEVLARLIAKHDDEPIKKNQFLRKLTLMNARLKAF